MTKRIHKTMAILMVLMLLITAFRFNASAADIENESVGASSGTTGDCTWKIDGNGTLTISGSGRMENYNSSSDTPWGTDIKSAVIENGVTYIGAYAFKDCIGLASVYIPESVTYIGERAFQNCTGLVGVYINDIEAWCKISWGIYFIFSQSTNPLYYAKKLYLNNQLVQKLIIPESVTKLESYSFYGCTCITSVMIPNSVTSIGYDAFYGCTELTGVYIKDIADWCGISFANMYSNPLYYAHNLYENNNLITNLIIPDSVKNIGDYAFYGGTSVTSVTVHDSITNIGNKAFYNTAWYNNQQNGVIYAGNFVIQYKGAMPANSSIVIRNGTKGIAASAFENCTNLTSIIIPQSVENIGEYSFYGCTGLTGIIIPDNVIQIGDYAFSRCTGITGVVVGEGLESIGESVFSRCSGIKTVTLSQSGVNLFQDLFSESTIEKVILKDTVTSIDRYAFDDCTSLKSIIIPRSVTSIGYRSFDGCTQLTNINIPDSVTSIGSDAFNNTQWYNNQPDGLVYAGKVAYKYKGNMPENTSIAVHDGIVAIADSAFSNCSNLIEVTFPNSVKSIGKSSFYNCTNLKNVTLGNGVLSIGDGSFSYCSNLTNIIIGDSVTTIGDEAFSDCKSLERITIPKSVTSIGSNAFWNCANLNAVYISELSAWCNINFISKGIVMVGANGKTALHHSSNPLIYAHKLYLNNKLVEKLEIPEGVTSISSAAFIYCTSITSVHLPASVNRIGDSAFRTCIKLKKVTGGSNVEFIANDAFFDCIYLESISFSNQLTVIASCAFNNCCELSDISFPDTLNRIGRYTFYGCKKIKKIEIPKNLKSIYEGTFKSCSSLESVNITKTVTTIDSQAFYGCTGLTSVTIPDSVASIGIGAFEGCTSLKDVYYSGTEDDWNRISIKSANNYLLNASIHFRDKGGYVGNNAHDYSRFYDFSYSDDIWTAPRKDGTVPVEMDLGLYQDEGKLTKMNIKWSYSMFGKSSHIADNDLAIASLVLSANAYDRGRQRKTLEDLGFSKIEFYNDTGYDDINRVENVIASTVQPINGKQTNVIVIACRGSVTLHQDWVSNIVQQAQGFRYAAEDIKNDLVDYIKTRHINTSMPTKVLLTGHSRGAAAANILASIIPSDIAKKSDIFTYTFACPNTTNDAGRENYPIFNILNSGDPVTQVPVIYDACPRFGAYNIWFDKATAKDFNSYFTAVTGLNDVTYVLDYPLAWCNGAFGNQYMYPFRHHSLALYLAFLLGEGIENNNSPNFNKKRISIECPVNVSVYDSTGQLLGTIKDNVADDALLANGIIPVIDGDKKYLYMTSNRDISLQLTGSDSGQMKYTVQDIDLNTGEVSEQGEFSSVALENGKTMTSAVASDIAVKDTQLYVSDGDSVLKKVSDNGEESDVVMISFDTGAGEKLRDMAVKKGTAPIKLPKATLEGYGFDGWYRDKECTEAFDETQALNESTTLYASFYQSQTAYAGFTDMSYDGSKLEARVKFEYNHLNGQLAAVLYKDDNILACSFTSVTDSDSTANFSFSVTGLSGLYELKLFCINNKGQFEPAGKTAGYDVNFYSDFLYSGNNYRRETVGDKALSLVKDGNIIVPESLNVNGQTFDGWYFDEAFMTKFDFDATDIKDTTLYAKWNMGLIGDVNGDNKVDITDATAIQRHLAEMESLSGQALALADVNLDGVVDINDATHLQKYLAEFDGIVLGKQN